MPQTWSKPLCLVEGEGEGGKLKVHELTIEKLSQVTGPMVIVAIVGLYRTGKSFLLNHLTGYNKGFQLGSSTHGCTRGIWVWLVDHPNKPGWNMLLMDTEGLGDVDKGDQDLDTQLFTLAVLLSSTLVYNSKGTIDDYALANLHFVTTIADHLKTKKDSEDDEDFVSYFPSFVWAVRDFTLKLDASGSDGYLERALTLKKGKTPKISDYNRPRQCITGYFPARKCFTFPFPLPDTRDLDNLQGMTEEHLSSEFVSVANSFRRYIYTEAKPKKVENQVVTGRILTQLAREYVGAINEGHTPCIHSAVESTAVYENTHAVEQGITVYQNRMTGVKLPTTADVLSFTHLKAMKEAIGAFLQRAMFDNDNKHQQLLKDKLTKMHDAFSHENNKASLMKCSALLDQLSKELDRKVACGGYMVPGGYKTYMEDFATVQQRYDASTRDDVMATEAWQQYYERKDAECKCIVSADQKLTDEERKKEEAKRRLRDTEEKVKLAEGACRKQEQEIAEKERIYQEQVIQMQQKAEEDRRREKEEMEQFMEEQQRALQQGLQERAEDMDRAMEQMKEQQEEADKRHAEEIRKMDQSRREEMARLNEQLTRKRTQEYEGSASVFHDEKGDASLDLLQAKAGLHEGDAGGMIGASANLYSAKGLPVNATVGLSCDTGATIEDDSVSVKALGTGITLGRKVEVSFLGTSIGVDFGKMFGKK